MAPADWVELPEPLTVDEAELEPWWVDATMLEYAYVPGANDSKIPVELWRTDVAFLKDNMKYLDKEPFYNKWGARINILRYRPCP